MSGTCCTTCGMPLNDKTAYRNTRNPDRYLTKCRACRAAYNASRRERANELRRQQRATPEGRERHRRENREWYRRWADRQKSGGAIR